MLVFNTKRDPHNNFICSTHVDIPISAHTDTVKIAALLLTDACLFILTSWPWLGMKPLFTVGYCQDLWLMWTDKGISTINCLWPSNLSFYCFTTQRKQGLLCYCWMREKE